MCKINKLFFVDENSNIIKTYNDLITDINSLEKIPEYIQTENTYDLFVYLVTSILNENEYTLLDSFISNNICPSTYYNNKYNISSIDEILNYVHTKNKWKIGLYTSGTTGKPKLIKHNIHTLTRNVKKNTRYEDRIWGLCYNPTHIAGLQVFFQAFLNMNTIINLFGNNKEDIYNLIRKYSITNLSATSSFYRYILPLIHTPLKCVKAITLGGERFDNSIVSLLKSKFPQAKIRNIYASTEFGTLFVSDNERFIIDEKYSNFINISANNELMVHRSLVGDMAEGNEWFYTGDIVEKKSDDTLEIIGRKDDMVSVGGYIVNTIKIENIMKDLDEIKDVQIKARKNKIIGNILIAEVIPTCEISDIDSFKKELHRKLTSQLNIWEIPRIFNIVDTISYNRAWKKVKY